MSNLDEEDFQFSLEHSIIGDNAVGWTLWSLASATSAWTGGFLDTWCQRYETILSPFL